MNENKIVRESGIELLRILAMFGVVLLHCNSAMFNYMASMSVNKGMLMFLESIAICAVDLFLMVSGFFLCTSEKRKTIKPIELYIQMVFIRLCIAIIKGIIAQSFSPKTLIIIFIPDSYFIVLYIVVYILSPYLNIVLKRLDPDQLRKFIIIIIIIFSMWNTLADLVGEVCHGGEINGLSTIGMYGAQDGFTIVNFFMMYLIGAYLRLQKPIICDKSTGKLIIYILLVVAVIFGWSLVNEYFATSGLRSAWEYCNPFVILLAVLVFALFLKIQFKSNVINTLAKGSFTCFLFHNGILSLIDFSVIASKSLYVILGCYVIMIPSIYLVSFVVFWIYDFIFKKLFLRLNMFLKKHDVEYIVNLENNN